MIEKVIACATRNGARVLGLSWDGQVTENAPANFIVVKGDPSHWPESPDQVLRIYDKGNKINLEDQRIK